MSSASIYDISLQRLNGAPLDLGEFRGRVLLLVNVASACGLTPQYEGLQSLYARYESAGFSLLGIPCNDFEAQEPGTPEEIQAFCSTRYAVEFPLSEKIHINQGTRHPLYVHLIAAKPYALYPEHSDFKEKMAGYGLTPAHETDVAWNFEKFLVDRTGMVIGRFSPDTQPDDPALLAMIETALAAPAA